MKKSLFLLYAIIMVVCTRILCQTPGGTTNTGTLKIMDLSAMPAIENAVLTNSDDSVSLQVLFLINDKAMASKAFYLFGTTADTGDVLTREVPFISQGSSFFLDNNGKHKKIEGYHAKTVFRLSKAQSDAFKCLTVYVQKPNGQISNKLYFKKH